MKFSKLFVMAAVLLALAFNVPAQEVSPATISGYKWHDLNADGIWDAGEPGLESWIIECWDISGESPVFCCFTTTDADGYYEFNQLVPGVEYAVCELLVEEDGVYQGEPGYPIRLAGSWFQSYPTSGPDTIDGSTIHAELGPVGRRIILTPGEVSGDNNFGNCSISPGFTLTKTCTEEPVQFGDDAVFEIELANTGNVDLIVKLDEDVVDTLGVIDGFDAGDTIPADTEFTLPVGQTLYATVAIEALTYPSVGNTINAVIKLPEWTGMSDSWTPTASDSCDVINMSLDKQIGTSADGPWYDNLDPVPVGTPLYYRMVVTYNGQADLKDVVVEDPTLGVTCNIGDLQDGGSYTCGPYGPYPAQYNDGDELCNTATATGTIADVSLFAEDTACYTTFMCYSETAYGYNADYSTCFLDLKVNPKIRNWGWSNELEGNGTYEFDIYAAAGQCILDNGILVGTLTVTYSGSAVSYEYELLDDYEIVEEHFYAGSTPTPVVTRGKKSTPTVAPGQYYVQDPLPNDGIYIIFHAVVEWCELPE